MSVTYVYKLYRNGIKRASLESMVRIADVFGVTVDQLLNGNQVHDSAELRKE